jgi:O-succinylbenzoate synthase
VSAVRLRALELIEVGLPLVAAVPTSFGEERGQAAVLVHALADEAEGWGRVRGGATPDYSSEWIDGSWAVLERSWRPPALAAPPVAEGRGGGRREWQASAGHRMAKAAAGGRRPRRAAPIGGTGARGSTWVPSGTAFRAA